VRSHSLRAWAIGRAQMAMPSKECTLLHTIYNTNSTNVPKFMSNELESDSAMMMNLERFGVDGASSTNPQ
jgi:hypothetical protein